jgi:hypothetical protein
MINDVSIEAIPGKWYLDRDFGVYDLTGHVKAGNNQLVLKANPMSVYAELQAVFILGDFSLISQSKVWKIMAPTEYKYPTHKTMPPGKDYDQLDFGIMNNFKVIEAD